MTFFVRISPRFLREKQEDTLGRLLKTLCIQLRTFLDITDN